MATNTIPRNFDIGRQLQDHEFRLGVLERLILQLRILFTPGVVYDTGWVAVPAAAGFASSLEVRRIGHLLTFRGLLTPTVDWGAANSLQQPVAVGGIPVGFRTPVSLTIICPTQGAVATTVFRVVIQSSGGIAVRCSTAAHASAVSICHSHLDS